MSTAIEHLQDGGVEVHVDHGERTDIPLTILVTPYAGRLRILPPERFWQGHEWVESGQAVAIVERGDAGLPDHVVRSPARGRLGAVLGRDGEPVTPGQAVAWVENE